MQKDPWGGVVSVKVGLEGEETQEGRGEPRLETGWLLPGCVCVRAVGGL